MYSFLSILNYIFDATTMPSAKQTTYKQETMVATERSVMH